MHNLFFFVSAWSLGIFCPLKCFLYTLCSVSSIFQLFLTCLCSLAADPLLCQWQINKKSHYWKISHRRTFSNISEGSASVLCCFCFELFNFFPVRLLAFFHSVWIRAATVTHSLFPIYPSKTRRTPFVIFRAAVWCISIL